MERSFFFGKKGFLCMMEKNVVFFVFFVFESGFWG